MSAYCVSCDHTYTYIHMFLFCVAFSFSSSRLCSDYSTYCLFCALCFCHRYINMTVSLYCHRHIWLLLLSASWSHRVYVALLTHPNPKGHRDCGQLISIIRLPFSGCQLTIDLVIYQNRITSPTLSLRVAALNNINVAQGRTRSNPHYELRATFRIAIQLTLI